MQFVFTRDMFTAIAYLQAGIVDVAFVEDSGLVDMPPFVLSAYNINISALRVLGPQVSAYLQPQ